MDREALQALKVVELKERLKSAGLPVSGRKDDLIERLLAGQAPAPAPPTPPKERAPSPLPRSPMDVKRKRDTSLEVADKDVEADAAPSPKRQRTAEAESSAAVADPPTPTSEAAEQPVRLASPPAGAPAPVSDLYLDTIDRDRLDFDFERLCSVTLSNINIYACLVCGRYFQGRGKSSPAYAHSIGDDHHVFINLHTLAVYVLPDAYEVSDPSLDDIKYLLNPTFRPELLRQLDAGVLPSYDLHSVPYRPGFVGLNNIKANDYMNVVVQALSHVVPFRDYFVSESCSGAFERDGRSELVKRFGMLLRKLWNPRAFKAQVSPHEFGQEVGNRSDRRFLLTQQADPIAFLSWLLNTLHRDLGGTKRPESSIVYQTFQGEVRIDDQDVIAKPDSGVAARPTFDISRQVKTTRSPFLFLTLDLPPPPVFQDAIEKNIIPQVSLASVLAKYNGVTTQELPGKLRRHHCRRLPPFLILHVKRFTSNNFVDEKNPTILNFATRGVTLDDCVEQAAPGDRLREIYDLVANITYSSEAGTARQASEWKVQVHTRPSRDADGNVASANGSGGGDEAWFQIQDLMVEEVNRQMIFLGESYIQASPSASFSRCSLG